MGLESTNPGLCSYSQRANDHLHPCGLFPAQVWASPSNNRYQGRIVPQGGLTAVSCLPVGAILRVVIGFEDLDADTLRPVEITASTDETQLRDDHDGTRKAVKRKASQDNEKRD